MDRISVRVTAERLIQDLIRRASRSTAHGALTSDDRQLIRWTVTQIEESGNLKADKVPGGMWARAK